MANAINTLVMAAWLTREKPAALIPAPKTPATSEWLTLTGKPNRVAVMTQITAASTAAKTALCVMKSGSTIPLPMVFATAVPVKAPSKFIEPPKITAALGVRARVATTVAIALAASFKPLL